MPGSVLKEDLSKKCAKCTKNDQKEMESAMDIDEVVDESSKLFDDGLLPRGHYVFNLEYV
jgi:hypothetical protein